MKYILIPIFRLVSIPIWIAIISFAFVVVLISCAWDWDITPFTGLFEDNSGFTGFWRSDDYRASGGKCGYYYKTVFHYIINKKTYANG